MPDMPGDMADPLSRGDGKALEAAREVGRFYGEPNQVTDRIVSAYFDALLSELPEEAVRLAEKLAQRHFSRWGDTAEERQIRIATEGTIRAFLRSLRSSSRGPADVE